MGLDKLVHRNLVTQDEKVRGRGSRAALHPWRCCLPTFAYRFAHSGAEPFPCVWQGILGVHDQLRDMGRALEELTELGGEPKRLGDRQRIWDPVEYSKLIQVWGCLPLGATCSLTACPHVIAFIATLTAKHVLEGASAHTMLKC